SSLFPADQPDRLVGFSEQPTGEPLHGLNRSVAVRAASDTTDLHGWTHAFDCGAGLGAATTRVGSVRTRDSDGFPGSLGWACSASQGTRDASEAGNVGRHAAGPIASFVHAVSRWR